MVMLIALASMVKPGRAEDLLRAPPSLPIEDEAEPQASEIAPQEQPALQSAPADPTPRANAPVRFANVPLPPTKPVELQDPAAGAVAAAAAAIAEPETAAPAPAPTATGNPPQVASLSQDEPPQQNLPLPPSMRDAQPPDADSDGEEEASSPGNFEKQVETVDVACVKPAVLDIVKRAGLFFQAVPIVTSGFRARGRRGSLHRRCMAVDFVVPGISTQTLANYLRSQPDAGGVGTYCNTRSVHVDIGEKRNWGYCGFHRTYFSMR